MGACQDNDENKLSEDDVKMESEPEYKFVPPSLRDDAPLAGIINPEIEDIDPRYVLC